MAERLIREGGKTSEERLQYGFRLATSRYPTPQEISVLKRILDNASKKYKANPEAAKQLLAVGEAKRDEALPADELAAWTIIASSILNLDETLTRE